MYQYSSTPLLVEDTFQNFPKMSETMESTKPYIYYIFFPMYTYL